MAIDRNNYQEYFLLYVDRELDRDGQRMLEDFVQLHPDLDKEFDELKQTVVVPPVMIYEGKEKLFRVEKRKRHMLPVYPIRIAATLMILLTGGWFLLLMTGKTKRDSDSILPPNEIVLHQPMVKEEDIKTAADPAIGQRKNTDTIKSVKRNSLPAAATPKSIRLRFAPADEARHSEAKLGEAGKPPSIGDGGQGHQLSSASSGPAETSIVSPSAVGVLPDIAQNNTPPEPTISNPSIHHSIVAAGGAHNASAINHQPSTINQSSILIFNHQPPAVGRFFKKLIAKSSDEDIAADHQRRRIKISVFQFSVKK